MMMISRLLPLSEKYLKVSETENRPRSKYIWWTERTAFHMVDNGKRCGDDDMMIISRLFSLKEKYLRYFETEYHPISEIW